jgi:hypothetical protein
MTREIVLDVSGLPAPEPMETILSELDRLPPGRHLRVLHRRAPWPLLPMLDERGFRHRLRPCDNPGFEILIWRAGDADPVPGDVID